MAQDRTEWVNRITLVRPTLEGGLDIFHIPSRLEAFRCDHLRRLFEDTRAKWKSFACYWVGLSLRRWQPQFASNLVPHSDWQPDFYRISLNDFKKIINRIPNVDPKNLTVKVAYRHLLSSAVFHPGALLQIPSLIIISHGKPWIRGISIQEPKMSYGALHIMFYKYELFYFAFISHVM